MFSYRHAFHAGNHADVLKHAILLHILDYYNRKDSPYWVVDTHAGAGVYDLTDAWAEKTAEFRDGIERLWHQPQLPELLANYIEHVRQLNDYGALSVYPGSPWIALQMMRPADRLRLFELHPTEITHLDENIQMQSRDVARQVSVFEKDGFTGLLSQLPPAPRRGIILIDPSYEDKNDYRHTLNAVKEGLKKFATGCFAVWYPLVRRKEVHDMQKQLEKLSDVGWVHVRLAVKKPPENGYGLYGSAMFVVNPPYTLAAALRQAGPVLESQLAQDGQAQCSITHQDK
ncbi:23S rRNA (adenine(2030)-N(6))-methyltransferase RlmJ [Advenella sp. S44]|uniref:23S rRNA (adenine(2030)-N(6))-methyltransferase RlmJ n=1 Tax=Advenella sp. S44 TaxID=1982755 RepID=UPI000C298304|nr:23S rRNA (adenine(2030)-N(6))-methyltransferase RlmJ [Advenella sp. S44]PJX26457.1 23S rRNA (adenine(2030)-N(6))-methyltransferase RlmJ [Advenella sp. S44]